MHVPTFNARVAVVRAAAGDGLTERMLAWSGAATGGGTPNPATEGFQNGASLVNWSGSLVAPGANLSAAVDWPMPICWY